MSGTRKGKTAIPNYYGKKCIILPSINNFTSRKEWENACWDKISKSEELLDIIVTVGERGKLARRAAAINDLTSGKSYRKIGEELWLSPQTISGLKKAMSEKNYRSYKDRSRTERKAEKFSSSPSSNARRRHGRLIKTKYGFLRVPH